MFQFVCCDCEPLAVTLSRARLWAATPVHPQFCFSFELLDWMEALLLECQVALKDFSSALKYRNPFSHQKVFILFLFCFIIIIILFF